MKTTVICLKCRQPFESKDPKTNRICLKCQTENKKVRDLKPRKDLNSLLLLFLLLFCSCSTKIEVEDHYRITVVQRSPKWPTVRNRYVKIHNFCEACGIKYDLDVHHIVPFHINPSLELVESNLITLCRKHHFQIGHLSNWTRDNPNVRQDAKKHRIKYGNM